VKAAGAGRVVSLVPSITETLLAWGVTPVGVSRFCDAPGVTPVGGTKNPDLEAIRALEPDLVLMDREENRREDAEALEAAGQNLLVTHVRSLGDVGPALRTMAEALGVDPGPVDGDHDPVPSGFTVWVPIWRRPWMTINAATYGSSLLAAAGLGNVYQDVGETYPVVDLDEARQKGPDYVLAPSEPYPFSERHRADLEEVAPAVFVDGRDLFWWGVRSGAALSRLRDLAVALRQRQVSARIHGSGGPSGPA
jgi:ABC-type Fe3+-hydroxamate transport system substrate-binding protein